MRHPSRLRTSLVGLTLVAGLVAGLGAGLGAGLAAPTQAVAPPPASYRLPVTFPTGTTTDAAGNTLLTDDSGRVLQLHGANLGKVGDITERGVAEMAAAGLTLLRLPIQWEHLEPTQGSYDAAYVQQIRDALTWAHKYGVLVIVDWHQDVYGPAFPGFDGAPAWTTRTDGIPFTPVDGNWFYNYFTPAVQAAFRHLYGDADLRQAQVAAWTHLAHELKGSPALLGYDLFNEPPGSDADIAAMYRRLITGIRTVDARSWLWVEPTVLVGEGIPTALPGFKDPRPGAARIGYAPHAYSTAVEEGGDWDTTSSFVTSYESAITDYPRKHRMPVIVGEWGPATAGAHFPGNVQLVRTQVPSFARFASGWAIWYACTSADGSGYCIFSDDAGHLGRGRAAAWTPYAVALAGRQVSLSSTTKRFALAYRPAKARGTTVVVVPSGFAQRLSVVVRDRSGHRVPAGVTVSRPSAVGARVVRVIAPTSATVRTWTVTITTR